MASIISRPVSQWPLLLCGPILRNVEPESVSVFVALKASAVVTLQIIDGVDPNGSPIMTIAGTNTIALGEYLHVLTITANLAPALVPGKIYGYQLKFTTAGTGGNLGDLGLLTGPGALGYETGKLPGFALAPKVESLNFVHGSCRKPHSEGRDALAAVDYLMRDRHQDPIQRPHYLFFTGDQIYADDVAVCLCAAIRATAGDLLGWQEAFPRSTSKTTVNLDDPTLVPGPDRRKFLADEAKLTSDETDGHMMFLGEYYAMYLMTWSQELWPRVPSGQDAGSLTLPSVGDVLPQTASDATMAKAVEERTRALQFARSIQRARRVLANIPTYMICDDHDVTDDWFLHRQWEVDSRTNPVTRRIMRNALIAYAIFQAWGNNPTYFTRTKGTTPPQKLFEAVTINSPATGPPIQSTPDVLDVPLDLKPDGRLPDGSPDRIYWGWGFKGTGHQVIALDTRTRRQFPAAPAPPKANVGLMTAGAMADLATSATNFSGITIILSPAPVFGNPRAELLIRQRIKNAKPGVPAEEQNDNETWIGNRPVFEQFLRVLASFQRVVILSGDVHYGFSNQVAYFQDSPPPPLAARFVHLCSSAFHNESSLTKMSGSGGYTPMFGGPPLVLMGWLGFDKDLSAVFNDVNAKLKPHFMLYSSIPVDQAILMSMLNVEGAERFMRPAVVPTNGWATDDAVNEIQSLLKAPNGPPGWQYQIRYLMDERDQATQIAAVNGLQVYSQPPKDSSQEQLFRTLVFDKARAIVGNNNFGHVTFQLQGSQISGLVHKLYRAAQAPDGSDVLTVGSGTAIREVWTFTQHQASLTAPTISERPLVTK